MTSKDTKDIGIVFRPNQQCKEFALEMTKETAKALPSAVMAANNPHITAIHIANLNANAEAALIAKFDEFFANLPNRHCIGLPIKGIKATGGSAETGYKWLDLQFETLPALASLRQSIVETFCPFHNGTLTRMGDDKLTQAQESQIEKCGVTFDPYLPHITAWYVGLPEKPRIKELQDIAESLTLPADLICQASSLALVELGRNGNALNIIGDSLYVLMMSYN